MAAVKAMNKRAMNNVGDSKNTFLNNRTAPSTDKCPSMWFLPTETKALIAMVKPGDMLEYDRCDRSHWAVYVGTKDAEAYVTDLGERNYQKRLFDGTRIRINNYVDVLYNPIEVDTEEIERRIKIFTEETPNNMLRDSCLHFAIFCRFGMKLKAQPSLFNQMVKTLYTSSVFSVSLASGLVGLWTGDLSSAALGLGLGASLSFAVEALPIASQLLTRDGNLHPKCIHKREVADQNGSQMVSKSKQNLNAIPIKRTEFRNVIQQNQRKRRQRGK